MVVKRLWAAHLVLFCERFELKFLCIYNIRLYFTPVNLVWVLCSPKVLFSVPTKPIETTMNNVKGQRGWREFKVTYFPPGREHWQKVSEEINLKLQVGWSTFEELKRCFRSSPGLIFLCVFLPFLRGNLCIHLFFIPAGPLLSCGLLRPHQADPPAQLQLLL